MLTCEFVSGVNEFMFCWRLIKSEYDRVKSLQCEEAAVSHLEVILMTLIPKVLETEI